MHDGEGAQLGLRAWPVLLRGSLHLCWGVRRKEILASPKGSHALGTTVVENPGIAEDDLTANFKSGKLMERSALELENVCGLVLPFTLLGLQCSNISSLKLQSAE